MVRISSQPEREVIEARIYVARVCVRARWGDIEQLILYLIAF